MYAVQIGNYAWLGADGFVTTSARHAAHFSGNFPAEERAQYLRDNRGPALVHLTRAARDLYLTSPVTVIPVNELDARLEAAPGKHRDTPTIKPTIAAPNDRDATVRKNGITRQIYQWALDNPQATKAEAALAFPSANPSTLSVQFSAARRSQAV